MRGREKDRGEQRQTHRVIKSNRKETSGDRRKETKTGKRSSIKRRQQRQLEELRAQRQSLIDCAA